MCFLGGVSSFPDRGEVRCADEEKMTLFRTDCHYAMARERAEWCGWFDP